MNLENLDVPLRATVKNPGPISPPGNLGVKIFRFSNYLVKFSFFCFVLFAPVSISAEQISLGLGLLGWIISALTYPARPQQPAAVSRISWAFFPFLAVVFLSAIFADEKLAAFNSFRSLWVALAFLWAANWISSPRDFRIYLVLLVIVASLTSLVGIIQYLGGIKILGLQLIPHKWHATGFARGPMTFAGLGMVILCMAIPVFFPRKIGGREIFFLFLLISLFLGLLYSNQRGAWVGFMGGILLFGVMRGWKTFLVIILCTILGFAMIYKFPTYVRYRASNFFNLDTNPESSVGNRFLLWQAALQIAWEHPFLGTGFNQFEKSAQEKILPRIKNSNIQIALGHAHSNFLQILATTGILGIVTFAYLWIIIFLELFRSLKTAPPDRYPYYLGILCALASFHIEGFFEYTFGDAEIITLIWFLLGGTIAMEKLDLTNSPGEQSSIPANSIG